MVKQMLINLYDNTQKRGPVSKPVWHAGDQCFLISVSAEHGSKVCNYVAPIGVKYSSRDGQLYTINKSISPTETSPLPMKRR